MESGKRGSRLSFFLVLTRWLHGSSKSFSSDIISSPRERYTLREIERSQPLFSVSFTRQLQEQPPKPIEHHSDSETVRRVGEGDTAGRNRRGRKRGGRRRSLRPPEQQEQPRQALQTAGDSPPVSFFPLCVSGFAVVHCRCRLVAWVWDNRWQPWQLGLPAVCRRSHLVSRRNYLLPVPCVHFRPQTIAMFPPDAVELGAGAYGDWCRGIHGLPWLILPTNHRTPPFRRHWPPPSDDGRQATPLSRCAVADQNCPM